MTPSYYTLADDLFFPLAEFTRPRTCTRNNRSNENADDVPVTQPNHFFETNTHEARYEIDLPGVEKDNISLELRGRRLVLTGKRYRNGAQKNVEAEKDVNLETNGTNGAPDEQATEEVKTKADKVDDPEEAAHGDTAEKADKVASRRPILKYRKVLSVGQKGDVAKR